MNNRHKVSRWSIFLLFFLSCVFLRKFTRMPWVLIQYYDVLKNAQMNDMCIIPRVDPYDPSIKNYISKSDRLRCKQIQLELVHLDDDGILSLNETVIQSSGFSNLDCSYRCFRHNDGVDDDTLKYDEWVSFKKSIAVQCEFIEVRIVFYFLWSPVFFMFQIQLIHYTSSVEQKNF